MITDILRVFLVVNIIVCSFLVIKEKKTNLEPLLFLIGTSAFYLAILT